MKCINRSSRWFKELAEHYNVDPQTLELLVEKYWKETGNENYFPSDVYIQARLGKGQFTEPSKDIRTVWEKMYNAPKEYPTFEELTKAKEEALLYFRPSAVFYYKNHNGNYVLTIKEPVVRKSNSIKTLLDKPSYTEQELADYNLVTNGELRPVSEQFALGEDAKPLEQWEQEVNPQLWQHMTESGLPISFKSDMEKYLKEHGDTFIQKALDNSEKDSNFAPTNKNNQYGTDRSTKENINFPKILGEHGEGKKASRTLAAAAYNTRRGKSNADKQGGFSKEKFLAHLEVAALQQGTWIENVSSLGERVKGKGGAENELYLSKDGKNYIKLNRFTLLDENHNIEEFVDRINSHNEFASNVPYEVLGFAEDSEGNVCIVLKQPIVKAREAAQKEIDEFLVEAGFERKEMSDGRKGWSNGVYEMWDADPSNVLVDSHNNFYFIDAIINNTERLKEYKELDNIQMFTTPEGEVYGFVDKSNRIYLDETVVKPEHSLHEYTHLWDRVLAQKNPELWKKGISLMRQTNLWREIVLNDSYGKKWRDMQGMTPEKFDALVASEVHSRLVGQEGQEILRKLSQEKGTKGIIKKLKAWLLDAWKELKATFSDWSKEDIDKLTLEDFNHMTIRDFTNGERIAQPKGTFTFKDGITVKAPFAPNYQQVDALNAMSDFVDSNETVMTLSGYAGTGKTSIMEMLAQKMKQQHKPVAFCATTNKAAAVLNDRVSKSGFEAHTLNKLFGISVEVNQSTPYNANDLQTRLTEAKILPGTTVIIDEASMINEENYGHLNRIARENGLKIIYVGDEAQLPPVKEDKISIVFRDNIDNLRRLTIVERTDDNAILKEATALRNNQPLSGESSFNKEGKGVAYMKPTSKNKIKAVVEEYVPKLQENPDYFRILAFTNEAVTRYNDAVRKTLGYEDNTPRVGEPIVGYSNWGYEYDRVKKVSTYRFINSEAYKVRAVGAPITVQQNINGTAMTMQAIPITIEDNFGNVQTINFMDVRGNAENRAIATRIAQEKAATFNQAMRLPKKSQARRDLLTRVNALEKFLFVNDAITDPVRKDSHGKPVVLQKKVFDFGYAMTVHKSQGSTFTHVLMDDVDIQKASSQDIINLWDDVAPEENSLLARASDVTNTEDIGGFDDLDFSPESAVTTSSVQTNQLANVRQQLRYVAVSRATDTVTIISNNVKKEGSPLASQSSINKEESNISNNGIPASYEGLITPSANTVFVFGSNPKGIHGAGAAATAKTKFGAIQGQGEGMQGNAYALPTKDLDKAKNTRWYRPGPKEEAEVKEWYKDHSFSEVQSHPLNVERTMTPQQIIEGIQRLYDTARQNPDKQFKVSHYPFGKLSLNGYLGEEMLAMFKQAGEVPSNVQFNKEWADHWNDDTFNAINQKENRSNNNQIKYSNEFRRIQETVRKGSNGAVGKGGIGQDAAERLGKLLQRELESQSGFSSLGTRVLTHSQTGTKFTIHEQVDPQLFHDVFEVVKFYTKNGELVDLHDDYSNCKCYLNEDGTCGFAIEPDGNLVSVFNLQLNKGFLSAVAPYLIEQGATHLDAYNSSKQPLKEIYERVLGAKVASSMDYNMEFDHDNIAANYGNPEVVFMVMGKAAEGEVTEQHFDKDSYDDAVAHQKSFLSQETQQTAAPSPTPSFIPHPIQMSNLAKETGEAMMPVDEQWKEQKLLELDRLLGEATTSDDKLEIIDRIHKVAQGREVKLPGYEHFNDLHEDTIVDADWKIPMLRDLDSQLSNDNTTEQNEEILSQMDDILNARSEEEYYSPSRQDKEFNEVLGEYDKLTQQIDALLEGKIEGFEDSKIDVSIKASEVRDVAQQIADSISDLITRVQTEEGAAAELFPLSKPSKSLVGRNRKDIVKALDINNFIAKAKEQFENTERKNLIVDLQADLLLDNWDAVMYLAADVFAQNEGFGIVRDYSNKKFGTTEAANISFDNFNEYETAEDLQEKEGDDQEHWQVESRTIDTLNSMSELVRQAIHGCYKLDKEGKPVISKWGMKERVAPRKVTNSILKWTQGALTLPEMVSKLRDKQAKAPWLDQLLTRLEDTTGKEADLQSQFFSVFSKHFQSYSIVQLENGKYVSKPLNSHPVLSEAVGNIQGQFKAESHPLLTNKGINKEYLEKLREFSQVIIKANNDAMKGELEAEGAEKAAAAIAGVSRILGYMVPEEMVADLINSDNLSKFASVANIVRTLDKVVEKGDNFYNSYDPFAYEGELSIGGKLRVFLSPIAENLEDEAASAFYESGKMYQSYVTPSYLTKLMKKLRKQGIKEGDFFADQKGILKEFLDKEYGFSEFFKNADGTWRTPWLKMLIENADSQDVIDHKVELAFNKHNYMRNMTDSEYTLSLISEYFSLTGSKANEIIPAWFRVPILSNKPSSEFIKFYSFRGDRYKERITNGMFDIYLQELSLIQTVIMRAKDKKDAEFIKDFDKNGRKFNFLPFLNSYLENTTSAKKGRTLLTEAKDNSDLATLLQKKTQGLDVLTAEEEARLIGLVKQAIRSHMEERTRTILDNWEQDGIFEAADKVQGIYGYMSDYVAELRRNLKNAKTDAEKEAAQAEFDGYTKTAIRASLENFIWNDTFAAMNILEMTVTTPAFYKDAEALQKRLAQLHAPGMRANVSATDYDGNRVSDGFYRTAILTDFDTFKSNIIENIREVFDKRIEAAPEHLKAGLRALQESLVGKDGKYTKINVADAQAFSSPASYRKKAFMFGRWSTQAENIYQKLLKGEYTFTDLETAFPVLKPFVFSHLHKDIGEGSSPIRQLPVPFQAKNAEYLLIMADAILQGAEKEGIKTSRPNLLRAIYRMMEESERINPTKGIDTVQFESAIKSGLQGKMNIHQFLEMDAVRGEEAAYRFMMNNIYKEARDGQGNRVYRDYNTRAFVHEAPYEDYCLQQEVPEHFKNHEQAHGSQIRMIIPSDLDYYRNPNLDHNDPDNQVFYEFTDYDADGNKIIKKLRADEFRKEYEQNIANGIEDSLDQLAEELCLNHPDKRQRNVALSKILQREILGSPRYGIDLVLACSVDKKTGEFRIPKGDPIQAKRIEQLINSVIKNRVNKQTIAGGPIVQVSNFGTSRELHIRFKDKQGNLLMTQQEYEESIKNQPQSQADKFNAKYGRKAAAKPMSYKEYIKQNQAGITYFEVFIPIWHKELFEKFANPDGTINIEAMEAIDPDLLKMVSYRIPTEDKYSCAPMKAVGFMPREAGEAIMLPQELTEIDDSDFDVDKRYVMRKDIKIVKKDEKEIYEVLDKRGVEIYKEVFGTEPQPKIVEDLITEVVQNPDKFRNDIAKMQRKGNPVRFRERLLKEYQKVAYITVHPTEGKAYRDNKTVEMSWSVLTNEMTADKILNPGGFDPLKKAGYQIAAYKTGKYTWEELDAMSIDELSDACYVDKDLMFADTQIQFYTQNSAAASLIGVFAVNKVAHAILENNGIHVDVANICGKESFTIGDTTFEGMMEIDKTYDEEGNFVGKSLGMGVSASADAAKTPVLNLMNINMTTVGVFSTLLRMGMSTRNATLFMSQDIIGRVLKKFNQENLNNYVTLDSVINGFLENLREEHNIDGNSNIETEALSTEEMIEGITAKEHPATDYKVLLAFQKLRALTDAMRKITFVTRFNSISSAVGPLIIDNLIIEHKMEQFTEEFLGKEGTHFFDRDGSPVDITDIFYEHPVLKQFAKTVDVAKDLFSDMPAGSSGFRGLLRASQKFLGDTLTDRIFSDKKLLDSLSNFYQSYLAIASGLVDETHLEDLISNFPKEFTQANYKEKYPDNAFIQAINTRMEKKSGKTVLEVKLTGEDESYKEELRNAWTDLHKANPELSQKLFEYSFFRAGIGFSPKTFMALVPAYVKERLSTKLSDDSVITYLNTYRHFASVNPNIVLDQWVRNNWDNSKLAPWKNPEEFKMGTNYFKAETKKALDELDGAPYVKLYIKGEETLWRRKPNVSEESVEYEKVTPLGNNGEFLQMSKDNIVKALSETTKTKENNDTSDINQPNAPEVQDGEPAKASQPTMEQQAEDAAWMVDTILGFQQAQGVRSASKENAEKTFDVLKRNPEKYSKLLENMFKFKGIDVSSDEAVKRFKKLC